jgi:hypothetical protein
MADWRNLERKIDGIEARRWGETVRLSFFDRDGRSDPDRQQTEIRAILHVAGDVAVQPGPGFNTRLATGTAELIIDRSTYAGPPIRTKDSVRAIERDGAPLFDVRTIGDRFSNLLVLSLGQA